MAFRGQQQPKPFDFVPLPDHVERAKPAGHDGFKKGLLSGIITGELVALTPVHVASGNIELTRSNRIPLVKAHFRTGGKIAIPSSSLKGAVRSIVEAITRSCVRVQSRTARSRLPSDFEPCEVRNENSQLCPACRMFGAMGYQGQVRFDDAVLIQGRVGIMLAPPLFRPRADARIYYDRNGQLKGRKFYFHGQPAKGNVPLEVCDVGSRFRLHVDFYNLTEAELGVLLIALGQGNPALTLKLGGAKPICCGSMEIQIQSIQTRDGFSDASKFDSPLNQVDHNRWLSAAQTLLVHSNLEKLHSILQADAQRLCPERNY
ncbi:MAG TPA: hypothetical protein EYP10_03560 [Armatimonadetes bacterium]|nr:hypothetical protein [Armatimonadota bacterium]